MLHYAVERSNVVPVIVGVFNEIPVNIRNQLVLVDLEGVLGQGRRVVDDKIRVHSVKYSLDEKIFADRLVYDDHVALPILSEPSAPARGIYRIGNWRIQQGEVLDIGDALTQIIPGSCLT